VPKRPENLDPAHNPSRLARRNRLQTWLVLLIARHTPKCREVVRILSDARDRPLPLSMRLKLRLHFLMCCWCQRYAQQLKFLGQAAGAFPEHADEAVPTPLSSEAKERMKRALQRDSAP
jgi:hypothetical protein